MEPHVLGAVLYWLLLPFALLAGEWGRRGELSGDAVRPAPPFPARLLARPAGAGAARARAGGRADRPGRAALGARIPEA